MPVTKTAKRALRGSLRKQKVNKTLTTRLEIALRTAKKNNEGKDIKNAFSLVDKAVKKKIIHKNKAARVKSSLSKLISTKKTAKAKKAKK